MRCLLVPALALGALLAACDGGKEPPPGTPASPAQGTAVAAGAVSTPKAPHAPELEFEPGVKELYQTDLEIPIDAGAAYSFDVVAVAKKRGVEAPPCEAFVFLLSWQVRRPYPPDGIGFRVETVSSYKPTEVGSGTSGQVSAGCTYVRLVNASDEEVRVEMRFGFGERQQ